MAFIQGTGVESAGSVASVSKAFASNITASNHILVGGVASVSGHMVAGACSDSRTQTYTRDVTKNNGSVSTDISLYHSFTSAAGALTVTLTPSASDFVSIGIAEWSGTTPTVGVTGNGTANGTTPATGSFTTTGNNSIIVALFAHNGGTITLTKGATYTLIFSDSNSANMPFLWEYKIVAAGATTADGSLGSSVNWVIASVEYKTDAVAAAAKAPPPFQRRWRYLPRQRIA